jgi:hypothetical protein
MDAVFLGLIAVLGLLSLALIAGCGWLMGEES